MKLICIFFYVKFSLNAAYKCKLNILYYYMRNLGNLIVLEQWYFSLICNTYI